MLPEFSNFHNLEDLTASNNNIATIQGIKNCETLGAIYLGSNQITSITNISNLPSLNFVTRL